MTEKYLSWKDINNIRIVLIIANVCRNKLRAITSCLHRIYKDNGFYHMYEVFAMGLSTLIKAVISFLLLMLLCTDKERIKCFSDNSFDKNY